MNWEALLFAVLVGVFALAGLTLFIFIPKAVSYLERIAKALETFLTWLKEESARQSRDAEE